MQPSPPDCRRSILRTPARARSSTMNWRRSSNWLALIALLLSNREQYGVAHRIDSAVRTNHRRRIGFENARGESNTLAEGIGREIPAAQDAVRIVDEYRIRERINGCGINAPF